ncbi:MAG: hypothetical protein ACLFPP_13185 [Spirochaetaceae bacterium]
MIETKNAPSLKEVAAKLPKVIESGAGATQRLREAWDPSKGAPVYTAKGVYATRGWTEWTQGFQFGNALYLFDMTGDRQMLDYGREGTLRQMATHVSHVGVHDHGFNNVSTYGNLLRLMKEGRIEENRWERSFYELALELSGAIQAARWTETSDGLGFVHSFNGPHSLFSDTIRSMRVLALGYQLGHLLMGEQDRKISLLTRLLLHAEATARYNVYFGTGRDSYDIRGRVVHESIFNTNNGVYRCPSTQQGYAPFTTWTRGLSWILSGYPEQLEWLEGRSDSDIAGAEVEGVTGFRTKDDVERRFLESAAAVADFHIATTPTDGIPYWDTGAPGLERLGDYTERPADPFNEHEPVDSSAGAISAQGLLRLGRYLERHASRLSKSGLRADDAHWPGAPMNEAEILELAATYRAAGLRAAYTLFDEPYLSSGDHQGILLHSVYHRPNGWDYTPDATGVPRGESCMWGDYHLLELAAYIKREAEGERYLAFYDI